MRNSVILLAACAAVGLVAAPGAGAVDIDAFVRKDRFEEIKISPNGDFFAATVPMDDRTALVVMDRAENKIVTGFNTAKNAAIADFVWVSPDRLVVSTAEKFGSMDQPRLTGELFSVNTSGRAEMLVGQRLNHMQTGSNIKTKKVERVAAFLTDDLRDDDRHVIISVMPFTSDPFTRAERLDVTTGRRVQVARAPVRNARFATDNAGAVRFALGAGVDNVNKLYYRPDGEGAWTLLNDEALHGRIEQPIGFSEDNATAYLQVEQATGPDAIVAMDVASGERREILRDDNVDPARIIRRPGSGVPVGAVFLDGKPESAFFDAGSPEARLQRSLEAAFPGEFPFITSSTADGRLTLVQTWSDRNPGDFYIFDSVAKTAEHVISSRDWFDPAAMATTTPFTMTARDGVALHGFLTRPRDGGKGLPMVVLAHGGPFGIYDQWQFDTDRQLLAAAGYAVLQVNFRGSGNYGRAFEHAGARQWGGAMQDDVTDATRWAIGEGHADPLRICIFGGSYGAYAALMGVAREPAMYRCAVGYVGVYDLPMMHSRGDVQQRGSGETFINEWIGPKQELAAVSPNRMAERIKVPVFLAAGGEDERAPIEHSKLMEKALLAAGVPVETLYYPTEGHGFYVEANRREFYARLLAFLGRHIGGAGSDVAGR